MNNPINVINLLLEKINKDFGFIKSSIPTNEEKIISSQIYELILNFIFPDNCEIDINEYLNNVLYNDDIDNEKNEDQEGDVDYIMLTNEEANCRNDSKINFS